MAFVFLTCEIYGSNLKGKVVVSVGFGWDVFYFTKFAADLCGVKTVFRNKST
jgi:hypothetical protein